LAALPLDLARTCKKQQAVACWKCCKTHNNVKKISIFYTEIFLHKISASLIYEMTYPRGLAIPKSECERI
jgi:hypothetical protein